MTVNRTETAKKFLAKELAQLSAEGRQIVERFINRGLVARNCAAALTTTFPLKDTVR